MPAKAVVYVDGGARGNPGPAAIAAVIKDGAGEVLDESSSYIGAATNNVAEYKALLLGLKRAFDIGCKEVEVINDSELVARQVNGLYKVKNAGLRPLYLEAMRSLQQFEHWSVRNVPREMNEDADSLVNQAIDAASE